MKAKFSLIALLILITSCSSSSDALPQEEITNPNSSANLSYLALGDSYTIGESVEESMRWPVQLTAELRSKGISMNDPKIIAKTGWTTQNLLNAMEANLGNEKFDLVSVLIGVNNQYQNRSIEEFEADLNIILTEAIGLSKNGEKGVFIVSIPDYGATPFGANNAETIGKEIDEYNNVLLKAATQFNLDFYDITPISKKAKTDLSLVAGDGLHPSGKMYTLWVESFFDKVLVKLQ